MPCLTEVHLQNYRSFLDAKCRLSPVTVVIGANNAGKSNFLRGINFTAQAFAPDVIRHPLETEFMGAHHRRLHRQERSSRLALRSYDGAFEIWGPVEHKIYFDSRGTVPRVGHVYCLDAGVIGGPEPGNDPHIEASGVGVTAALMSMWLQKSPAYDSIENEFRQYVPEVEEIAMANGDPAIHVTEAGLFSGHYPLSELSSGSRTILALLTIIHQPNRPELILLEDIEHAIHPRGLASLVEMMRRMAKEHGVQFIFTTQSPYVLDCFQKPEYWDDVVIVEKRDGVSTLTNAKDRLVALGYEREMAELPLGDLWYSGALGGVAGPNELWDEPQSKS